VTFQPFPYPPNSPPIKTVSLCFGLAWINARCSPKPLYHSVSLTGLSPHPSFLPRLNFTPNFSASSPQAVQPNREWGLQSVHYTLSMLLLHSQEEDSSHSSPAPVWGPSHGRQFSTNFSNVSPSHGLQLFMNFPSVGLSHGVQSFRRRLFQRGSSTGSQALPASLLCCGLLSPRVCRSWQEPAPVWAPCGVTDFFRHIRLFHRLQVDICSTVDLHGLQG